MVVLNNHAYYLLLRGKFYFKVVPLFYLVRVVSVVRVLLLRTN